MGLQITNVINFPLDFVITSRTILIIHWHCLEDSYANAQL